MAGQLARVLVKIPNGTATSGEIDLRGYRWVGIQLPAAWTAADITAASRITQDPDLDGTTTPATAVAAPVSSHLVDAAGAPVKFAASAAITAALALAAPATNPVLIFTGAVKDAAEFASRVSIRSSTAGAATAANQGADRYLWLIVEPRGV